MVLNIEKLDFNTLYKDAEIAFKECVSKNENSFFADNIEDSLNDIKIKEDNVRIKFLGKNKHQFVIEINILLISENDEEIGWYSLQKNEKGEIVDDYLVFH